MLIKLKLAEHDTAIKKAKVSPDLVALNIDIN